MTKVREKWPERERDRRRNLKRDSNFGVKKLLDFD